MRRIQTTDIVPAQVLLRIAERVRTVAAQIAKRKRAPLKSSRSGGDKYNRLNIGIGKPVITQGQTSVVLTLSDVAYAFEHGGQPHPITPRNKESLSFAGTNAFKGYQIVTKYVNHPGFEAKPFLEPARRQTRQENLEDISKTSLANLRLIVTGMRRVV